MATFKINKRYSVTRDKYQWILLLDERPHRYYKSLEHVFEYLLMLKISESKALEVKQLINSINKARMGFNKLSTLIESRFESDNLASQSSKVEKAPLDTKINKTEAEGRLNTSLPSAHNQQ